MNAISVPERIYAWISACDELLQNLGSTLISFPPFAFDCCINLKPIGWFSAALLPMSKTTSAFLISGQLFVMHPLPNDSPRAATVTECQRRAQCSRYTIPRDLTSFVNR